jgi:hypothetical protein
MATILRFDRFQVVPEGVDCPLCGSDLDEPLKTYWRLRGGGAGERVPDSKVHVHASCILDRFHRVERSDANVKSARKRLGTQNLADDRFEYIPKPIAIV